jgi:hypothetical protein
VPVLPMAQGGGLRLCTGQHSFGHCSPALRVREPLSCQSCGFRARHYGPCRSGSQLFLAEGLLASSLWALTNRQVLYDADGNRDSLFPGIAFAHWAASQPPQAGKAAVMPDPTADPVSSTSRFSVPD